MRARPPAFQFYPRQFLGDEHVMAMDLDAVGAHILLLSATAGSPEGYRMSTDERAIRNRLRNPPAEVWERIKPQLFGTAWKLSADGKWWEQDGLLRSLHRQKEFSEIQKQRANKRWHGAASLAASGGHDIGIPSVSLRHASGNALQSSLHKRDIDSKSLSSLCGKSTEVIPEVCQNVPHGTLDLSVEKVARAHPANSHMNGKGLIPGDQERAIAQAIVDHGIDKVMAGTLACRDQVAKWPTSQLRYTPNPVQFYQKAEFLKDPAVWDRSSAVDQQRDTLRASEGMGLYKPKP